MKVSGTHTIAASRQQVWDAINDPAVLAATLPGCESLEVAGDDTYLVRVTAGVASVRGTYTGQVELSDKHAPGSLRLQANGSGTPGTIGAEVDVEFTDNDGHTTVAWDADAIVGGMIGGVGQRMLAGVSKKMAGEFFEALEHAIIDPPVVTADAAGVADQGAGEPTVPRPGITATTSPGNARVGQVFAGSGSAAGVSGDTGRLVGAFVLGAAVGIIGVLIGRATR